jgi:transposase
MQLVTYMPMSAVAQYLGEIDTTLWRIFKYYVAMGIDNHLELSQIKKVCVDETAIKRGHHYMTIFTDYDTGQVIYVVEGRKKEVFDKFYGWLFDKGGHPKNIELFSMDMSKSFKAVKREYFAHSEVVFDRFHIKKALNEAVDKVRKSEIFEFEILKNTKYLWLKNEQNLSEKEKKELDKILEMNSLNTTIAYKLKNEFDMIWSIQKNAIEPALNKWIERALNTAIKPIITFVKTLNNHWKGILNAMKILVNNGISEGINSKIQVAKSKARGYPNFENFKNMVYYIGNDSIYNFH